MQGRNRKMMLSAPNGEQPRDFRECVECAIRLVLSRPVSRGRVACAALWSRSVLGSGPTRVAQNVNGCFASVIADR